MTTHTEERAIQLRMALADVLEANGQLSDPTWRKVFEAVPRHPFVPEFWTELVETKGLPGMWPEDLDLGEAPALVRDLASRGLWLEQEPVAVDARTPSALEALLEP